YNELLSGIESCDHIQGFKFADTLTNILLIDDDSISALSFGDRDNFTIDNDNCLSVDDLHRLSIYNLHRLTIYNLYCLTIYNLYRLAVCIRLNIHHSSWNHIRNGVYQRSLRRVGIEF